MQEPHSIFVCSHLFLCVLGWVVVAVVGLDGIGLFHLLVATATTGEKKKTSIKKNIHFICIGLPAKIIGGQYGTCCPLTILTVMLIVER